MTTRTERVVLELDDQFSAGMARAAASTAVLRRELDGLNGTSLSGASRGTQTMSRDIDNLGRSADRAGPAIDRFSGRLGIVLQAATVLGPALIPIGAVGIPAVTGLANSMAAAGLAGGSLIIAMQGVGDAVKAIDAYRLDPTAESLAKARTALEGLGPEAREFVGAFQDFQPVLTGIRDAAAEGWFPGLTDALDSIERVAPRVETMMRALGETGGGILANAADSLGTERWTEFLDFLSREMPSTLLDVSSAVGDLAHGMAELWMAFDPLNDDFSSWMVDAAEGFDAWAQGLSQTEGFADFVEYIQTNGPQVRDTLAAFAVATMDFVQAAAPVGGPVLQALEGFANAISAITNSPIGGKIATMAAAFVILNKTLAISAGLMARLGFVGAAGVLRGAGPAGAAAGASGGFAGMVRGLTSVTSAQDRARMSASQLAATQQRQAAAMSQLRRGMVTGAAGAVAFAVASGKLGDGMGLTNTAMLALMGSMTGPWGAAVGGGIGLLLDFREHTNDVEKAQASLDGVLSSSAATFGQVAAAQEQVAAAGREYMDGLTGSTADLFKLLGTDPVEAWKLGFDAMDGNIETLNAIGTAAKAAGGDMQTMAGAFLLIGQQLGDTTPITAADIISPDVARVEGIIAQVQPAMQRLGITLGDVAAMDAPQLSAFIDQVVALTNAADTPTGRIRTLNEVITNSGEVMLTASGRADALRAALDGLLSPQMGLTAATDAWTTALRSLNDDLAKNKTLQGDSNAAITNRAAIQARISDLTELLVAERRAGAGPRRLAAILKNGREDLIEFGKAAGMAGPQLRRFLNAQGLSGQMLESVLRKVRQEAQKTKREVETAFNSLPEDVQTNIRTKGVPKTKAEIDALVAKYKLTEEERQALVTLRDLASGKAAAIRGIIESIRDKSVTITTYYKSVGTANKTARDSAIIGVPSADGSTVPKTGLPYADRHPYLLADGEEVISNRFGQADKNRYALKAANRGAKLAVVGFADGGTPGGRAFGFTDHMTPGLLGETNKLSAAMRALTGLSIKELKARDRKLAQEIRLAERELRRDERAFAREERLTQIHKERVEALRQERDAIRDSVAARFQANAFEVQELEEGQTRLTPEGVMGVDIADAAQMIALIQTLQEKGLDKDALTYMLQNASEDQIRGYAMGSQADVDNYERIFDMRARLAELAGMTAANAEGVGPQLARAERLHERQLAVQQAAGAELRETTRGLRELNRSSNAVERRLGQLERQAERAEDRADRRAEKQAKDTAKGVADAVNGAAVNGVNGRGRR